MNFLFISITAFANPLVNAVKLQQLANQYLKEHRTDEHISAVAITVQYAGNQVPISVYTGHTSYNNQKPMSADNLFQIGSITKSFTSAIILQLERNVYLWSCWWNYFKCI